MRARILFLNLVMAAISVVCVAASPRNSEPAPSSERPVQSQEWMRAEGEQRFQANCSRCHAAPHKFPPRMMATIVRHMRVRATITDQDMKYILYYVTQ